MKKISEKYKLSGLYTDKDDLGYLENFYDQFLINPHYENILEIGCRDGGSIALWEECFPQANIFGADIIDYPQPRLAKKLIGNAYTGGFVTQFADNFFDVIIDDGPHTYPSFVFLLKEYYSKLKVGGAMIIEDIIRPYKGMGVSEAQQNNLAILARDIGYKNIKTWDMTNKPRLKELRNKWSAGLYILTLSK